jgi:hypothetical protein
VIMIISTFKSINKAYVDQQIDLAWPDMAELLSTHFPAESKEDVPLYNAMRFKTIDDETAEQGRRYHYLDGIRQETYDLIPGTIRRSKSNVLEMHGIVLDVDEAMTIEQVQQQFDGLEYLLYTTFRHKLIADKEKFRVIIPFSKPLVAADIAGRSQSIIETFPGVDAASFTVSQSFYFHSGNHPDRQVIWNKGIMLDPYEFEYREPKQIEYSSTGEYTEIDSAYKEAVVKSLMTCSGLHYHSAKSRYGVLTLVSICKSIGLSYDDFDLICGHMAHPESLLIKSSVRRMAWTSWASDRVKRETRDEFIRAYDGMPPKFKTAADPIVKYYEIQKRMKEKYGV